MTVCLSLFLVNEEWMFDMGNIYDMTQMWTQHNFSNIGLDMGRT